MAFARLDENNRIIEWCYEKIDGLDVEFSNGEYIDKNCVDGLDEFIIENGQAVYSPQPEKEIARLKEKLSDTDYISSKMNDEIMNCTSIVDILSVTASFKAKYGDIIKQRQEWRNKINELQG